MPLHIGSRVFAPAVVPSVAALVLITILLNLGLWQLRRADEKRALMAQAAAGRQSTLTLTAANAGDLPRYQHVQLSGQFDGTHQVLLDSMPSKDGAPGYRVLTPLQLTDGSTVLVDRGWLPLGVNRHTLPQIDVNATMRALSGIVDVLPQPGVRAGNAGVVADRWPQVLNYPRYEELRQLYGEHLQQRIVLLDPAAADGFERVWQINLGFGPERHIGYAVQWFSMAFAVLIIYVVTNLKRPAVAGSEVK